MSQPHALDTRRMPGRPQMRRLHQLDASAGLESKKAGLESLRCVDVARADLCPEGSRIESAERVQVVHPQRNVLDTRHVPLAGYFGTRMRSGLLNDAFAYKVQV